MMMPVVRSANAKKVIRSRRKRSSAWRPFEVRRSAEPERERKAQGEYLAASGLSSAGWIL